MNKKPQCMNLEVRIHSCCIGLYALLLCANRNTFKHAFQPIYPSSSPLSLCLPSPSLSLSHSHPPPSLCHTPTPPPPPLSLSISSPFSVGLIITSPLYSLCLPTFSSSCPPPSSPCVLPLSLHLFLQCQKIFEAIGKAFKTKVYMYLHLFH